jgi:hypothetical protein
MWWPRLLTRRWTDEHPMRDRDVEQERAELERQRLQLRAELGWREPAPADDAREAKR